MALILIDSHSYSSIVFANNAYHFFIPGQVGTGIGASLGILIRGGEPLEQTKDVTCMVFDKTGVSEELVLIVIPTHLHKANPLHFSHTYNRP